MTTLVCGTGIYWRPKGNHRVDWKYGSVAGFPAKGLVEISPYMGGTMGCVVVSMDEIEWREATK